MNYNLYDITVTDSISLAEMSNTSVIKSISSRLMELEDIIIDQAARKQSGTIGFYTLGLEIRTTTKNLFGVVDSKNCLFKATENRRAIYKLIFDWLASAEGRTIYILTFEKDLGRVLVDNSFIQINDLIKALKVILVYCEFKAPLVFKIIEIYSFTNALIVENKSHQNKMYYKIKQNGKYI